jgi:glycosyltransferase involved in cell wall biosynthesis
MLSKQSKLRIRVGRWCIDSRPVTFLIDFTPLYSDRESLYYEMWQTYGIDSSVGYGDYDESCIFSYGVALAISSFHKCYKLSKKSVIAHFNEWTLGMGLLYLKKHVPSIATVFTTHATTVGRSIAGNGKSLYSYMSGYNGDQMAHELNVSCKHVLERLSAHYADCFTTVSATTALECSQLLGKSPDLITPNGFDAGLVPTPKAYNAARTASRAVLLRVASKLLGHEISSNAFLIGTSGRYEYRNKGIDVYIDVMNRLSHSKVLNSEVIAFMLIPAWVYAPRADLLAALNDDSIPCQEPMQTPFLTHWLNRMEDDSIMKFIFHAGFRNAVDDRLKIIYVPCYVDGNDGIFNISYYDMLMGMDATVFPSYYEPWGYTPQESIAFGVPSITTNLSGFGRWVLTQTEGSIDEGVGVIKRTDGNYTEVVDTITATLLSLIKKSTAERNRLRKICMSLATRTEWRYFGAYYYESYKKALNACRQRIKLQKQTDV